MNQTYSIGDASKKTGVSQKQLRNWENRKFIPAPQRVVSGERSYRRYTASDLDFIRNVKHYLDLGFTLAMSSKKASEDQGKEAE